ncbi:MAG: CocE/NonD family hydrolase [Acidobacteria bacterium]|nr:CocE/NonD family hydrolase [Acidobacteriota bacterium]
MTRWLAAAIPLLLSAEAVKEQHVMVPMRDGVKLSVYLYIPEGPGPWPVLYEQRYASLTAQGTRQTYRRLASHGYVVAAENFRGTQLSEGVYNGYRALGWGELKDGFDTVEWLAKQPWSSGKIGTFGGSQAGYAQNFLAVTQPPHLVAQYMIDTGLSLYHEGYRIGGTTRPRRFEAMAAMCRNPADNARWMEEIFQHPTYDAYWKDEDCTRFFHKMNVPSYTVGSWYDFMSVGSIQSFIGRQHRGGPASRGRQQLILGPWLHGGNKINSKIGDIEYPDNAKVDLYDHMIRWFDFHLKGKANGVDRDPIVRYYVMGVNEWRTAKDWPVPARAASYYLGADGGLALDAPVREGKTAFIADPNRPAPILSRSFPGGQDARSFEQHPDVRTFTTPVLVEPVEWTGKVQAELWVTSSAPDTDFIARISDVYPDGRSILIVDSIRRARYRHGFEREVMMRPGQIEKVAFDLGSLSQVFQAGHRIRVTIASTGADFYEPNPNTGEPLTIAPAKRMLVARNTVLHGGRHSSRIIAPVVK